MFSPLAAASALFSALSAGLLVLGFAEYLSRRRNRTNLARIATLAKLLPEAPKTDGKQPDKPLAILLQRLGKSLVSRRYSAWLTRTLGVSGSRRSNAIAVLLAQKVAMGIAGLFIGAVLATGGVLIAGNFSALWLPWIFALALFVVPDILLANKVRERNAQLERTLPDALDLLTLCVEAGLGFEQAASRVSLSLNGPIAEELGLVVTDIRLGVSRRDALNRLAARTRSEGLQRFTRALTQVDRLGVPIGGVLAGLAADMRAARKDRAREQGQKVTVKILMPLMLCFLPAMFIVVLGPAMVQLMQALSSL
jgi:tight adherence protein C